MKTATTLLSIQWIKITILLCFLHLQALAFIAGPSSRVCPDSDNTSLTELNNQSNFCIGDTAIYVATFSGATDPTVTFYWDENLDGIPDPDEIITTGIQQGVDFRVNIILSEENIGGQILVVYEDSDCPDVFSRTLSEPLIIACDISIEDPCFCLNNTTTPGTGQFSETIVVTGVPGQVWEIVEVDGLYEVGASVPPQAGEELMVGDMLEVDLMDDTQYFIEGVHVDGIGYSIRVSNGIDTLMISNQCSYPDPEINLLANYCVNFPPFDFEVTDESFDGTFEVSINGNPETEFNAADLGPGLHVISYTFYGDPGEPGYPLCEQSRSQVVEIFNDYEGTISCFNNINVGFNNEGLVIVTPDLVLSPNYGCTATFEVEIVGKDDNILTCADANIPQMVIVRDPIRGGVCWSTVLPEDKSPPVFVCEDVTVSCTVDLFNLPADAYAEVSDNCGVASLFVISQQPIDNPSCDPDFSAAFSRTLRATDAMGNSSTCVQTIYLDRPELSDVDFPESVEISGCAETEDISPSVTGFPTINGEPLGFFCEISAFYNDWTFPICQGSRLVQRMWQVTDHCGGGSIPFMQNIYIRDLEAPIIECPSNIQLGTDPNQCSATYTIVPPALLVDNCVPNEDLNLVVFVNGVPRSVGDEVVLSLGNNTLLYRVNDPCSNFSNCTQIIEVVDTQTPTLVCNPYTASLDENGEVTIEPSDLIDNSYFDNCAIADTLLAKMSDPDNFQSELTYGCLEIGPNMLIIQVRDEEGNANTCMVDLTIQDLLPPTVVFCPEDVVVECNIDPFPDFEEPIFEDNCGEQLTISFTPDTLVGCCATSVITRTWVATDVQGMMATCEQVIEVVDNTPPTITCETEVTLSLDGNGMGALTMDDVIISATDLCCEEDLTFSLSLNEFTCDDIDEDITVTATVADECGNESTCDIDVIVIDDLAPVFDNCQDTINFLISDFNECDFDFYDGLIATPTASDNCTENIVVSRSFADEQTLCGGADAGIESRIYTFTASDEDGNVSTCITVARLIDDVAPVVTCVDTEVEIFLDSDGLATISSAALFVDIDDFCDINPSLIVDDFNFTCENTGPNEVIIRGIDCAGNIGACSATVVVIDDIDPIITCPADITVECLDNGGMPTDPDFTGMASATDNCEVALIEIFDEVSSGTDCDRILERTFRVVDLEDNEDFCTQEILIEDNTPPVSTCADPIEFITVAECDGSDPDIALSAIVGINEALIADCYMDECGNGVVVTNDYMGGSIMMDCEDFGGTINITYTVADDCANIATTIEVEVSLVDRTGPVFTTVPDDVTFECGDVIPDPNLSVDVVAVDECSTVSGITFEDFQMMTPWIVTSQSGNGLVDISDAPNSITIQSSNTGFNQNLLSIASSAAKAGTLSFDWSYETTDPNGPSNDPFGISIEGLSTILTDGGGAQMQNGSESFPIQAGNSIEIFIETLNNQSGEATVIISNILFVEDAIDCPVVECFIRRFVAEDDCGNQGVAYQLITIEDTEAPIISCQDVTLQLNVDGEAILDPEMGISTATDACASVITYEASQTFFDCLILGTQTVTITAADACGNESTCDIQVTVEDIIAPVLMCPDTVTFLMSDFGGFCGSYLNEIPLPSATDNCAVTDITRSASPLEGICGGTLIGSRLRLVEFVATDQSSNEGTCELVLRVIDDVAPTLTCVEDFTVSLDSDGNGSVEADDLLVSISDNCVNTNPTLIAETFNFTCADLGPNIVELSGTDCGGNIGTCQVNIVVEDNLGPELECVSDTTLILNANGMVTIDDPMDFIINLSDNCSDDFVVMIDTDEFDCLDIALSPISVQLVAIDEASNPTICNINITIEDQTAPVFANCTDRTFNLSEFADCNYNELLDASFFGLSAMDVCDGVLSIGTGALSNQVDFCDDIDNPEVASGTVTFMATDMSSNEATCEISWTVINDVPPTLDCETVFEVILDDVTGEATISATDIASASYTLSDCFTDPASWLTLIGQSSFDCSDVGADIEVMVEAATCGSPESTCTVSIEVTDPNPVSVSCPLPTSIECGSDIDAFADMFEGDFSANGTCLESTSFGYVTDLNDCGLGTVTFSYSAESTYGDVATCQVVVDVVQAPGSVFVESMIEWPEDFVSKCPVNLPEPITPQFTGGPSYPIGLPCLDIRDQFVDEIIEENLNGCQIRERTWTLTDECTGTSFDYTQIITLSLNGTQIVSGPISMQVLNDPGECGAQIDLDPLVATDCAGDLVIENDFNANGADASGFYPVGITTVNFTLLNGCADQEPNIYSITIEVVDNESPSLTCGANVTTTCSADLDAVVAGIGFDVMDNCTDLTLDTTLVFNLDACGVGFVIVTFSAADLYNQASCSRLITVNADATFELTLADFDLPADITLSCGEDQTTTNTGSPVPNNPLMCAALEVSSADELMVNTPELGCETILRTFTIEDQCSGDILEYIQTIVISSDMPNIISGPAPVSVSNDPGECGADLIIDPLVLPACANDLLVTNSFNGTDNASGFYPVGTTEVTFTVTNDCGNEALFIFEVTVGDDEDPIVDCPDDVSVTCQENLDDFITGLVFAASDNCGLADTDVSYDAPVLNCGSGTTTVTYTATDINGNDNSCSLEVTITPVYLQESDITWPDDYFLACGENRLDTAITGGPVFESFCGTPVATFVDADDVIDMATGCITFIRTWTITDVCNPVDPYEYDQTISVPNYGNLAELDDAVIMILEVQDPGICGANVTLEFPIGDYCADDVVIVNSFNGGGADASGFYDVGTTMVTYTISNSCGLIFTTTAMVTILDLTAPDVDCGIQTGPVTCADDIMDVIANWDIEITEPCPVDTTISLVYNLNDCGAGTVTFMFSVTDNSANTGACTRTINVSGDTQVFVELTDVSWPVSPLIVEDCDADIDPLVLGSEPIINGEFLCLNPVVTFDDVEIIPSDNPDYCRQFVRTWTITSSCDASILATFEQTIYLESDGMPLIVDGHIKTYDEIGVSNVDVSGVDGSRGSEMSRSLADGRYRLRTNIGENGLIVTPYKNDEALMGVSSMDLLSISRHLHGIQPLSNPYNIIAADVNRDGRITVRDIVILRDLLLGRISNLPEGNWRFVDKAYEFNNPLKPLNESFGEEVVIPYTDAGRVEADFVAVKMGDAFQSSNGFSGRQAHEDHAIRTDEVRYKAGEMLDVPLRLDSYDEVATFQFALRFDPAQLRFVDLKLGSAITEQHINKEHADLGIILISWDHLSVDALNDPEMMSIQFITGSDGVLSSAISITEYFIKPELYLMESTEKKMPKLAFDQKAGSIGIFELFQNQPNPFSNFTKIMFSIPESDDVNLTVYDVSGRVVHFEEAHFAAGTHAFILNNQLAQLADGTYFYRIKTSNYSATKKMILSGATSK